MDILLIINGDVFKTRRNDLNMTQAELADGLTCQATISNLEINGVLPNLDILEGLTRRLSLNVVDIFATGLVTNSFTLLQRQLDNECYGKVQTGLKKIGRPSQDDFFKRQQYDYLCASSSFHGGLIEDANFHCDQMINVPEKQRIWFYYALANTIKAEIWQQKDDLFKAGVCFDSVIDIIKKHPYTEPSFSMTSYIRIYQALAEHFLLVGNVDEAMRHLNKAFGILKQKNSIWHFGELMMIQAQVNYENKMYGAQEKIISAVQELYKILKSPQLARMLDKLET
ncbi:XRE family transcriptional regulator [Oenococcus sicerae]|uniref:helix-turn-helix domain-containing protein n=2 Tax=Oenococcus sicerae TaxID=2203724 RepID=UPI0039EB0067